MAQEQKRRPENRKTWKKAKKKALDISGLCAWGLKTGKTDLKTNSKCSF